MLSALPFGGARPILSLARFLLLLRLPPDERAWTLTPDDDSWISSWLLSLSISLTFRAEADVGLLCLFPCLDETAGAVSRWTFPFAYLVFALYADALAAGARGLFPLPLLSIVVVEVEVAGVLLFGIAEVEARDEAEDDGSDDVDLHVYNEDTSKLGRFALVLRRRVLTRLASLRFPSSCSCSPLLSACRDFHPAASQPPLRHCGPPFLHVHAVLTVTSSLFSSLPVIAGFPNLALRCPRLRAGRP